MTKNISMRILFSVLAVFGISLASASSTQSAPVVTFLGRPIGHKKVKPTKAPTPAPVAPAAPAKPATPVAPAVKK